MARPSAASQQGRICNDALMSRMKVMSRMKAGRARTQIKDAAAGQAH